MHYTEYFTLRDCSRFLQIRSHMLLQCAIILLNHNALGIYKHVQGQSEAA